MRNTDKQKDVKMAKEQSIKRKSIMYTDFSKIDKNDPLIKALEKRRPWASSDFVPKYFIPDLREKTR